MNIYENGHFRPMTDEEIAEWEKSQELTDEEVSNDG